MSRSAVLAQLVPPVEERIRAIEAEPLPHNLASLLAEAAADTPDAPALDAFEDGERLTYAELNDRVLRLARGLTAIGIGRDAHVGVMLGNGIAFPITWLALARLGAVMIPMNPAYTAREVDYLVANGEVGWLCVDARHLDTIGALEKQVSPARLIVLGETTAAPAHDWHAVARGSDAALPPLESIDRDALMNIQYTSGTTGFPKGCMLTQRYWLTIGKVNARRDGRHYKRILAATPFFYMDPQWQLTMAFYGRGCLYLARRQSASRFMGWVRQHRIQFALLPEIVFKQPPSPEDRDNEVIRFNVYGLSKQVHAAVEERFDVVAREAFGMTEIGSGAFMPMEAVDMIGSGACGRPSPFRELRIIDEQGRTLGPNEPGELVVRGPGILLGYYGNPEATKNAFIDGWFRTGDVARRDERGYFYIVGRLKEMIRRAGENISAREVEAVLRMMPEVADAAAVPVPDASRGEEVKVYVVLKPGITAEALPPPTIAAHCEQNLARFKVPRYYTYRDALPKTPSDKIAKHKLVAELPDLRQGAYDRIDNCWR
jgi:crotonobetaine/carnitine-CoA ligase